MSQTKYFVNQHPISIVLAWIEQGEIAIPEIQRLSAWHNPIFKLCSTHRTNRLR